MANETIADIVREMRERCIDKEHSPTLWPYLDRIEAAHKREVVVSKNETTTKENLAVGNNAKMCEVLGVVVDACDTVFKMAHDSEFVEKWAVSTRNVAARALAESPRNCDIGTAGNMEQRFEHFCFDHRSIERGCGDCPLRNSNVSCEFEWTLMPYEEGGVK